MKRPYEVTAVFRILSNDDEMQAAVDQVVNYIENRNPDTDEADGRVTKIDRNILGRRRLAYEIEGQRDGMYIVFSAEIEPHHLSELELNLKLYNPLLRYLIVRDEDTERAARKAEKNSQSDHSDNDDNAPSDDSDEGENASDDDQPTDDTPDTE